MCKWTRRGRERGHEGYVRHGRRFKGGLDGTGCREILDTASTRSFYNIEIIECYEN